MKKLTIYDVRWCKLVVLAAIFSQFNSCSSLGTKTMVVTPEVLPSIEKVAVWPVTAIPLVADALDNYPEVVDELFEEKPSFRKQTVDLGMYSEELVVSELVRAKLFDLVNPDSVVSALSPSDWIDFRLGRMPWNSFVNMSGIEYVLVTDIRFKTGSNGTNTYVTLSLFDWQTEELIAESKFNTMWGKNYSGWYPPSYEETLPDGIEGAVKGLAKAWKEHTGSD